MLRTPRRKKATRPADSPRLLGVIRALCGLRPRPPPSTAASGKKDNGRIKGGDGERVIDQNTLWRRSHEGPTKACEEGQEDTQKKRFGVTIEKGIKRRGRKK